MRPPSKKGKHLSGMGGNAIPLGRMRTFNTPTPSPDSEATQRSETPRPVGPPPVVGGRGRGLTMPAWMKKQSGSGESPGGLPSNNGDNSRPSISGESSRQDGEGGNRSGSRGWSKEEPSRGWSDSAAAAAAPRGWDHDSGRDRRDRDRRDRDHGRSDREYRRDRDRSRSRRDRRSSRSRSRSRRGSRRDDGRGDRRSSYQGSGGSQPFDPTSRRGAVSIPATMGQQPQPQQQPMATQPSTMTTQQPMRGYGAGQYHQPPPSSAASLQPQQAPPSGKGGSSASGFQMRLGASSQGPRNSLDPAVFHPAPPAGATAAAAPSGEAAAAVSGSTPQNVDPQQYWQ
ncbi:hypothetical protein FOZ62_022621, partial [Perkinsus olseni]